MDVEHKGDSSVSPPILSEALRGWYCCQGAAENEVGFLNHTILGCGDRF